MQKPKLPKSHHYHVYVIELDDRVWNSGKFRRCNPKYVMGKPFFYVGMTGLDPDVRFDKHKAGIQANASSPTMVCNCYPHCTKSTTR